jgi:hypothetical protein
MPHDPRVLEKWMFATVDMEIRSAQANALHFEHHHTLASTWHWPILNSDFTWLRTNDCFHQSRIPSDFHVIERSENRIAWGASFFRI